MIQAKITNEIDDVYVSSDSEEILEIASMELKLLNVLKNLLATPKNLKKLYYMLDVLGSDQEIIIMLEPTAPLRKPNDLVML